MAPKPDDKDSERACVVLSKGHEVVRLGYYRVIGVAAKVTGKTDRQVDRVGQVTRVSPNSSTN
jgi:hypothetical protein